MRKLLPLLFLCPVALHAQQDVPSSIGSSAPTLITVGPPANTWNCNTKATNFLAWQKDSLPGKHVWNCDGLAWNQNSGIAILGTPVNFAGSGAMTAQTICGVSVCPAGQYTLDVYVTVKSGTATVGTISALTLTYTDENGANQTQTGCNNLSLITPGHAGCSFTYWKNDLASTVTLSAGVAGIVGTPNYTVHSVNTNVQ